MMHTDPGTFAAAFAALFVAHQVADHWVQRDGEAAGKGAPGWRGRLACTTHVLTYTATALVVLVVVGAALGATASPTRVAIALGISAVSHWVIDRRWLLVWVAERTGSRKFVRMGAPRPGHDDNPSLGTGAYALDQSAHYLFLLIAALIIA